MTERSNAIALKCGSWESATYWAAPDRPNHYPLNRALIHLDGTGLRMKLNGRGEVLAGVALLERRHMIFQCVDCQRGKQCLVKYGFFDRRQLVLPLNDN